MTIITCEAEEVSAASRLCPLLQLLTWPISSVCDVVSVDSLLFSIWRVCWPKYSDWERKAFCLFSCWRLCLLLLLLLYMQWWYLLCRGWKIHSLIWKHLIDDIVDDTFIVMTWWRKVWLMMIFFDVTFWWWPSPVVAHCAMPSLWRDSWWAVLQCPQYSASD